MSGDWGEKYNWDWSEICSWLQPELSRIECVRSHWLVVAAIWLPLSKWCSLNVQSSVPFLVRNSRKIYNVKHIRNYLEMNDFPQRPGLIGWFQVKLENCLSVFSRVQTLNGSGLGQNQPGEFWWQWSWEIWESQSVLSLGDHTDNN